MKVEITLAQIHSEFGKPDKNANKVLQIINTLQPEYPHILLLPELWTSGFDLRHTEEHAPADAEILQDMAKQAALKNIWIGGSYLTQQDAAYYNTFVFLGPDGEKAVYQKTHLIRLMQEDRWFSPGKQLSLVKTPFAVIGLSICYDLRFPLLFQSLSHAGSECFLLPAAWPQARISHWETLLQARAIENQSFFIACNAVGGTHREIFGGTSMLISPWGESLLRFSPTDEAIQTTSIEIDEVRQLRESFPVLQEQQADQQNSIPIQHYSFDGRNNNTAS